MIQHTARGLASLGRNGDTMLVHMSPHEVAGLNYLAQKQGTKLTINPETGLPEAFSLGGFFKSLLPTFIGGAFGFAGAPLWAGIAAGAATGAITNKDNPLMGAAMGGFGGYGGMGLGGSLANTMKIVSPTTAATTAGQTAISSAAPGAIGAVGTTGQIGGANLVGSGIAGGTAATNATTANIMSSMNNAGVNIADPVVQDAAKNALQNIPKTSNFSGMNMDPTSSFLKPTVFDKGYGASIAQPSGTAGGSTLIGEARNLGNSAASAQSPLIAGAMSNSPPPGFMDTFIDELGGSTAAMKKIGLPLGAGVLGGLEPSDLYGEPMKPSDKDKYDPYATLNLSNDTGLRLLASGGAIYDNSDNTTPVNLSRDGFGIGRLNNLAGEQARTQAETYGYAGGGAIAFADGGDPTDKTTMDLALPEPTQGIAALPAAQPTEQGPTPGQMAAMAGMQAGAPQEGSSIVEQVAFKIQQDPNYQPQNPIEAAIVKQLKGTDPMQEGQSSQQGLGSLGPVVPSVPKFNETPAMSPTYYAGMNVPKFGMARGGYLDGQGDGMSDSIPATIEGKQPARLADGEFVVPADVVSHLGNGSSKAGSKRLYKMLDKVRHARTGTKKQGREINPNKYLPA